MHVALLGDSTLDNRPYTEGGPDVVAYLNELLAPPGRATLFAVDGAVMDDVDRQLDGVRGTLRSQDPVTHIVLSVGGNDLLDVASVLGSRVERVADGLLRLHELARAFGGRYRAVLGEVLRLRLPTVICTVYAGAFPDPLQAAAVETALRIFDHEIVEAGVEQGLPVLDLRRVCNEPADYFNPIEPNERGGRKIAAALAEVLREG